MKFVNERPRNDGKTVLLVEDEAPIRLLMRHILVEAGYNVLLATDGVEGQQKLIAYGERVDLLLTDLSMPGISGFELAQRAKLLQPRIKVLYASGSEGFFPDLRSEGLLLMKPFTVEELLAAVAGALQENAETLIQ